MTRSIVEQWPLEVIQKVFNYTSCAASRCVAACACLDWAHVNRDESLWAASLLETYPLRKGEAHPRQVFKSLYHAGERALQGESLPFLGLWRVGIGNNAWELGLRISSRHGSLGNSTGSVEISIMRYPDDLDHEASVFPGRAISLEAEFSVDPAGILRILLRATEAMEISGGMMQDLATLSRIPLKISENGARLSAAWPTSSPTKPRPCGRGLNNFGLHHPSEHRIEALLDPGNTGALPHNTKQKSYHVLWSALGPRLTTSLKCFGGPFDHYSRLHGGLESLASLPQTAKELQNGPWGSIVTWAAQWEHSSRGEPSEEEFNRESRNGACGYVIDGLLQLLRDGGTGPEGLRAVLAAACELERGVHERSALMDVDSD